jgi:hypothetical protein
MSSENDVNEHSCASPCYAVPPHLVLNAEKAIKVRLDLQGRLPVVYCGKSVEEWYSLFCQTALRLDKAHRLLQRAYDGMHKEHWQEGESEAEVCQAIRHFLDDSASA